MTTTRLLVGKWWGRLRLLLLVPLSGYVIWNLHEQASGISDIVTLRHLPWLALAGACLVLSLVLMAMRQQSLLRHAGSHVSFSLNLRVAFAGLFANNFMPGGMGYDLARLLCLGKHSGKGNASILGLVLLDRLLGIMGLSLLALGGFALAFSHPDAVNESIGRLLLCALLMPFILGSMILALRHENTFDRLSTMLGRLPFGEALRALLAGIRSYSRRKRILLWALLLATLGHFSTVVGVALITGSFYDMRSALGSTFATPLVFFASSIPVTPSNLGWTETVAGAAWSLLGLRGGVLIFLCWRLVCAAVSLFGVTAYTSLLAEDKVREPSK